MENRSNRDLRAELSLLVRSEMEPDKNRLAKEAAGRAAANFIQNGMLVGLGTGSTARCFIESLSRRCREGLQIKAAASSKESEALARARGVPLLDIERLTVLDMTVDGADEVDQKKQLIKGGGGALLREKVLAGISREMLVIVDEEKLVKQLGVFPLPLEIVPFAHEAILAKILSLGYQGYFRKNAEGKIFITDNGNYIVDIHFSSGQLDPERDHQILRSIPGVLETGLFLNMAGRVVVGRKDGTVQVMT